MIGNEIPEFRCQVINVSISIRAAVGVLHLLIYLNGQLLGAPYGHRSAVRTIESQVELSLTRFGAFGSISDLTSTTIITTTHHLMKEPLLEGSLRQYFT